MSFTSGSGIANAAEPGNSTVIVPNERLKEFETNYSQETANVHGIGWNNYWREEFGAAPISTSSEPLLDKAIKVYSNATNESGAWQDLFENLSWGNLGIAVGKRVINQTFNLWNWAPGPVKVKPSLRKVPTISSHNYPEGHFDMQKPGSFLKQLSKDSKAAKVYNTAATAKAKNAERVINATESILRSKTGETEK